MLHKNHCRIPLPSAVPALPTPLKWRAKLQQRRLVAEVSSLLLHRKNWIPLLRSNPTLLPRPPPPDLILSILHRTKSCPTTALSFFNWAQSNLAFQPDLPSLSKMAHILIQSDLLLAAARRLLHPVLRSHPSTAVLDSTLRFLPFSSQDPQSRTLDFILESYSDLRLTGGALETFRRIKILGFHPSTRCCNALLDTLCSSGEVKTAWCFYAAAMRSGATPDARSWSLLVRLLCEEGKAKRAALLLDLGLCGGDCYGLLIDCYCGRGQFREVFDLLGKMYKKNVMPEFGTYGSILDAGCRFGDDAVMELAMREMGMRGLLPDAQSFDYNHAIKKLSELGKTYAAKMFFERAGNEKLRLSEGTYACLLTALSNEGRADEAMRVYQIMLEEGVTVEKSCYDALFSGICKAEPSGIADRLLKHVIAEGFSSPNVDDLSKYIATQCSRGMWKEAGDLLNGALEKGFLPGASCCGMLVQHYCGNGMVDSAMSLHDKMKALGGCLDAASYSSLLNQLLFGGMIGEAIQMFDYMREHNVLSSASFVTMIHTLCTRKELKIAMELHDEMLKLGLKPGDATYKNLISGFV